MYLYFYYLVIPPLNFFNPWLQLWNNAVFEFWTFFILNGHLFWLIKLSPCPTSMSGVSLGSVPCISGLFLGRLVVDIGVRFLPSESVHCLSICSTASMILTSQDALFCHIHIHIHCEFLPFQNYYFHISRVGMQKTLCLFTM